jgi:hypothetical protein
MIPAADQLKFGGVPDRIPEETSSELVLPPRLRRITALLCMRLVLIVQLGRSEQHVFEFSGFRP